MQNRLLLSGAGLELETHILIAPGVMNVGFNPDYGLSFIY